MLFILFILFIPLYPLYPLHPLHLLHFLHPDLTHATRLELELELEIEIEIEIEDPAFRTMAPTMVPSAAPTPVPTRATCTMNTRQLEGCMKVVIIIKGDIYELVFGCSWHTNMAYELHFFPL